MKVLVVSSNALPSPPPYYGGLELVAFADALRLAQAGHDVYFLATKLSRASALYLYPYLADSIDAIRFVEFGDPLPWGMPANEEDMLNVLLSRYKVFDAIIDHSRSRSATMRLFTPSLAVIHDLNPPFPLVPLSKQACYAGVSKFHMNHLRALFPTVSHMITYVYDHIIEEPYLRVKTTRDRERAIAFVSRIDAGKGIMHFLHACRRMPDVKCYVIGDDMSMINANIATINSIRSIYEYARKIPNVEWMGLVTNDVKIDVMSRVMATVVLPAPPYAEVFGIWTLESLLLGTPAITTVSGAGPEIISNGVNGYVLALNEVVDALVSIVQQGVPVKMTPEEMRRDAFERFNSREWAERSLRLASGGCGAG